MSSELTAAQREAVIDFKPTAACINALPDKLRQWIMELETNADPAGNIRRAVVAEENVRALASAPPICRITAGERTMERQVSRILVSSASPGCTIANDDDLYDLGFRVEETRDGVTIAMPGLSLEIAPSRPRKAVGDLKPLLLFTDLNHANHLYAGTADVAERLRAEGASIYFVDPKDVRIRDNHVNFDVLVHDRWQCGLTGRITVAPAHLYPQGEQSDDGSP